MKEQAKYTIHTTTSLPIRIPPYVRRELRRGDTAGAIQLGIIQNVPASVLGRHSTEDTLPSAMTENVEYRRAAHNASRVLTTYAEEWGINRYCTVIHGSVGRGLIRSFTSDDPSDVDIDLVIDDSSISKEERTTVRNKMFELSHEKIRVDAYIWNIDEIKRERGNFARLLLGASGYPIANKNNLWEEVRWIGIESQRVLNLTNGIRKRTTQIVQLIAQDKLLEVIRLLSKETSWKEDIFTYLEECGLASSQDPVIYARKLNEIFSVQNIKRGAALYNNDEQLSDMKGGE